MEARARAEAESQPNVAARRLRRDRGIGNRIVVPAQEPPCGQGRPGGASQSNGETPPPTLGGGPCGCGLEGGWDSPSSDSPSSPSSSLSSSSASLSLRCFFLPFSSSSSSSSPEPTSEAERVCSL